MKASREYLESVLGKVAAGGFEPPPKGILDGMEDRTKTISKTFHFYPAFSLAPTE